MSQQTTQPPEVILTTPGLWEPENKRCFEQIEGAKFLTSDGKVTDEIRSQKDNISVTYTPLTKNKVGWNLCTKKSGDQQDDPLPFETIPLEDRTKEQQTAYHDEWQRRANLNPKNYWTPEHKTELWQKIKAFIYQHLELPDERQYDVLTAWIFACWIPERWDTVPYIFFFGPMASGKTRALASLQYLAYRANFSISCSPAALFRTIEKYNVIPFLDEAEVYNSEDSLEIIACLNAGYKRESGFVQRFQGDTENGDVVNFRVFGFKAIAGTDKIKNTLESRSIIIRMARNTRDVNVFIKKKAAQKIRDELLQWRFWALENLALPLAEEAEDTEDREKGIPPEFQAMHNSRVIELFLPLYYVSDGETKTAIVEYAQSVYEDQKDEESAGEEAEIVRALLTCRHLVENSQLELKTIFETVNDNRQECERFKRTQAVGKILWRLGFKKTSVGKACRTGIMWNEDKLQRLIRRYLPLVASASSASSAKENISLQPLTFDSSKILSCTALESHERRFNQVCPICNESHDTAYKITYFDKSTVNICQVCGNQIQTQLNGAHQQ